MMALLIIKGKMICVILSRKIIIKMYLVENKEVTLFIQLNW